MFFAIPLANKPTWQAPPWMTVLIILVNMLVYWGWQAPEEKRVQANAERYAKSGLAALEVPHYLRHLERQAERLPAEKEHLDMVRKLWDERLDEALYQDMWMDPGFRRALLAQTVIPESDPQHAEWRRLRAQVTPFEPQPFTTRWAQSFDRRFDERPETLLTGTFLHGSTDHLLGNMVFLFLFGFTLEMALGPGLYLLLYLLCGVGASAVSLWAHGGSPGYGLGASGAIAGLMAMYVVMYRQRRIQFFYMVLFYFNYARWPALAVLPVYMGYELLQQLLADRGVDYMAHLGGLVSGAVLMTALMAVRKLEAPANLSPPAASPATERDAAAQTAVERAQRLTDALDFSAANQAWQRAAQLQPGAIPVLESWFSVAQHFPASEEFHAVAKRLLTLPATDHAARKNLHAHYLTYLKLAKPGVRLSANTLAHLIPVFVKLGAWDDAQRLTQVLQRQPTVHPRLAETLTLLVTGLVHQKRWEEAMSWLPALRAHAPQAPVTQQLEQQPRA